MAASKVSSYPRLIKTLATEQKIVYLCGAGASMSLAEHRLSWPSWILAGKNYLTISEQDELDKLIGTWSADELINAVTYLLEKLKSTASYEDYMNKTVGALHPVNKSFIDALRKIWRAGDLITTANYDLTIEEAVNCGAVSYSFPAEILSIIRGDSENKVIHLHGVYDRLNNIDDIVADDPQYKSVLANSGAQFIQNLISTHPIVIVGCGGTVEDPNLSGFMNFVVDKLGDTNVPYFYLMKKGDNVPELPPNALPVFYGDEYADLPEFLSEMSLMRLRRRAGIRSVVAVNPYKAAVPVTSAFGRIHFSNGFSEFVGREAELKAITEFIETDKKFSWWTITGDGGIGKSRLVIESLRNTASNWFGFFTKKDANEISSFIPFTDTIVVFDYVLGSEYECAKCLTKYIEIFETSPYKLRVILIERAFKSYAWLKDIKKALDSETRLLYEGAEYKKEELRLSELSTDDEISYIQNYLKSYLPLIDNSDLADDYLADIDIVSKKIQESFRNSVSNDCYRPLYLSIFIEVWVEKEGKLSLTSSEDLLEEYIEREKIRWKSILDDSDDLLDSYLNLLAMACAIDRFNITDVYGDNYLSKACDSMTQFLDKNMNKSGFENTKADLSVFMDEQEEYNSEDDPILDAFYNPENAMQQADTVIDEEDVKHIKSMDQEDKFAYASSYIKLHADPNEVYLNMFNNLGLLEDDEKEQLKKLHERNVTKSNALPDHAWVIEATLPDIIREFVVRHVVKPHDVVKFTKLARSNSVLGLSHFLNLVLEDNESCELFQKIAITSPDEALNYFEYYISLLVRIDKIKEFRSVEDALLHINPIFPKYEIELWNRIAHVLGERDNMERLFDSGCIFIDYIKHFSDYLDIRDEMADVLKQYCVILHNVGAEDKFIDYVGKIGAIADLLPKNSMFGYVLCENYRVIIDGKFTQGAEFSSEWSKIQEILEQYDYSDDLISMAMEAAKDWMLALNRKNDVEGLKELEDYLETLYAKHKHIAVAEVLSLTTANVYTVTFMLQKEQLHGQLEKLKGYLKDYPDNMKVRSAYISVCREEYYETSSFRKVPDYVINDAKAWSSQYPDEIEFQESYFMLLTAKLEYAIAHDMRNEQGRVFKEMKRVADNADYEAYHEENSLKKTIATLRMRYEL